MKKGRTWTKVFIIFGIVLLVAAVALFVCGMSIADWDFGKLSTVRYKQKEYTLDTEEEIESLTVRYSDAKVEIVYAADAQTAHISYPVRIDAADNEIAEVVILAEDGALSIEEKLDGRSDWFNWDLSSPAVTVTLPADTACALDIRINNGTVVLTGERAVAAPSVSLYTDNGTLCAAPAGGLTVTGDATLTTQNGTIKADGLAAGGTVTLDNKNGTISASNVSAAALSADLENGNITLENVRIDGALTVENSNGNISMRGSVKAQSFTADTELGTIAVETGGVLDAETLQLSSNLGDITVRGALAGSQADYTLFLTANMGSSNLPSGGSGARRLTAATELGNITLRLEN